MNKELLENGQDVQDSPEKNTYKKYRELGGIINESDYNSALSRLETYIPDKNQIQQVLNMTDFAGIELSPKPATDPIVKLYSILRNDVRPQGVKYHHDQMSDQQILVEALRMLEDAESADKMINKHPHISFEYGSPEKTI